MKAQPEFGLYARITLAGDDPLAEALQAVAVKRRTQTLLALARRGLEAANASKTLSGADLQALGTRVERLCQLLEAGAPVPTVALCDTTPPTNGAMDADALAADTEDKRRNLLAGFGLTDLMDVAPTADEENGAVI